MSELAPILKWAGGKRQLQNEIIPLIPRRFECYYEPFVGAGAILLKLQPSRAVINDTNIELMNVYEIIRDQPEELIQLLQEYERFHCEALYYNVREMDRNRQEFIGLSRLQKAARTIYLNRTCYNGLYRVNKSGYFNTPMGRNTHVQIVNARGILTISRYLNENAIEILNGNYTNALENITQRDFVFLDPPYYPINRDSFVRYAMSPFGIPQQMELKEICDQLNARGVRFIQTNSNCQEIREMYANYHQIEVGVRRCINAEVDGRQGTELIIYNY